MYKILTIAGSDCSGGAGIQADIKTICAHKMYAMSAITSLTAQNTMGVSGISDVSPAFVGEQLDRIFEDIFPDAVKIGMVSSGEIIKVIGDKLQQYGAKNIVVDPVMVSTSGSRLLREDAIAILTEKLFPLATLITPNIPEAEIISNMRIDDFDAMCRAAEKISTAHNCAVLIKGGHSIEDATDVLYNGAFCTFKGERISNPNTHGTGCTLSSAIACNLGAGRDLPSSIAAAKEYISLCLAAGLDLGHGSGPLNHMVL